MIKFLNIILILTIIAVNFLYFDNVASAAQPPIILYTDILSGPNTGGENNNGAYLSIFGKSFSEIQGTSKVYINDIEVAAYKYWGTSIGRSDIQQISVQPGASELVELLK